MALERSKGKDTRPFIVRFLTYSPLRGYKILRILLDRIDSISEWSGRIVCWLILLLIFAITYDVGLRYLFSAPTAWSYDLSYMLGGSFMVLGGAYTLLHKGHVRVDIVYSRLSPRAQTILDTILTFFIFFPFMSVLLYYSIDFAVHSVVINEVSSISVWAPAMWPFRWALVIAISLFLLQGICWFIRNVSSSIGGKACD